MNNNKDVLNLSGVDINTKFNHCTVILYYAYPTSETQSSLGFHADCIYRLANYQHDKRRYIQVTNTLAIIYSLGDSRKLN